MYADASWVDEIETRRSTTGILTCVGTHLVDWKAKRQSIILHSMAEAEYTAADSVTRMIILFRLLLDDLKITQERATILHE